MDRPYRMKRRQRVSRGTHVALAVLAAAAAIAATTLRSAWAADGARPVAFGLRMNLLGEGDIAPLLNAAQVTRSDWISQDVNWRDIEPAPGNTQWQKLDAVVAKATQALPGQVHDRVQPRAERRQVPLGLGRRFVGECVPECLGWSHRRRGIGGKGGVGMSRDPGIGPGVGPLAGDDVSQDQAQGPLPCPGVRVQLIVAQRQDQAVEVPASSGHRTEQARRLALSAVRGCEER
ncbi:MAG: hypothetical protein AAB427_13405, partial [Chloroflexota bacterium]